ncbi:MAG: prepilin-type N-terminal cleavage/methylation domain-containing protein [Candidatus Poribacteria bacterium]|jgi:prepilin-type N-terminal cleavage/methylation domain-containing protein|nr:prepilin-type N-terminal cleavage/methylation domain-containing protein [Candidatus Poribacteria bacterium]
MKQRGLNLSELIVVIGVIVILAAIALPYALPQYNKYVTLARVNKALHHGQVYARKIESEAAGGGGTGAESSFKHATITRTGTGPDTRVKISLLDTIDSQVLIASDDRVGGKVLELTPVESAGATRWVCRTDLSPDKMPKVCTYAAGVGGPIIWRPKGCLWAKLPDGRDSIICPNLILTPKNYVKN